MVLPKLITKERNMGTWYLECDGLDEKDRIIGSWGIPLNPNRENLTEEMAIEKAAEKWPVIRLHSPEIPGAEMIKKIRNPRLIYNKHLDNDVRFL